MFKTSRKIGNAFFLSVESLEKRATPCGCCCWEFMDDEFCEAGDANCDGIFDSSDLVMLMQSGKFETLEAASWSEGDFNVDGVLDSTDLVFATEQMSYAA